MGKSAESGSLITMECTERLGGMKTKPMQLGEVTEVVVDTTVQEKAVTFPTDAKLVDRTRVRLPKACGVRLRQAYTRVGKRALIKHQRYAQVRQFKGANRQLHRLKTQLGRVWRDIDRKLPAGPTSTPSSGPSCSVPAAYWRSSAVNVAPKSTRCTRPMACFGKGKVHKSYEFVGVEVFATPMRSSRGRQFVLAAKAHAGKSLRRAHACRIPDIDKTIGATLGASSPMPAIAATMRRRLTTCAFIPPARSGA